MFENVRFLSVRPLICGLIVPWHLLKHMGKKNVKQVSVYIDVKFVCFLQTVILTIADKTAVSIDTKYGRYSFIVSPFIINNYK